MGILVTGGTGLLGREVVERLKRDGHAVRGMSRRPQPSPGWVVADLRSGQGVREAAAGMDVIVHCATAFGRGCGGR
jgi:nucleoside-diphosphate-sugar epimerase